jgi:hypothetical protein
VPTVTPSVNTGGVDTISAGAGSSGFAYEIVAGIGYFLLRHYFVFASILAAAIFSGSVMKLKVVFAL